MLTEWNDIPHNTCKKQQLNIRNSVDSSLDGTSYDIEVGDVGHLASLACYHCHLHHCKTANITVHKTAYILDPPHCLQHFTTYHQTAAKITRVSP